MSVRQILAATLLVMVIVSVLPWAKLQAAAQDPSQGTQTPVAPKSKKQTKAHDTEQEEGDRIFQQNCSRCHNAPDGFSSRISGTVVRHMRVRAGLSQHDAEELLRFFNP